MPMAETHASPLSKPVTYDSTYGELAITTRTGHTFNGWFTAATGGTLVTSASTVDITADQTLFAQWTASIYTVTFDANGGDTPSPSANRSPMTRPTANWQPPPAPATLSTAGSPPPAAEPW